MDDELDDELKKLSDEGTAPAPEGTIYVCGACGKESLTRYGFDKRNRSTASPGWDESCMLHAVLVSKVSIKRREDGRVYYADAIVGDAEAC